MSVNRISIDITEARETAITEKTNELARAAEDLEVVISREEFNSLPKVADGRIPFVEKAAEYAVSNPEHVPAVLNVAEFQKDVKLFVALRRLIRPLRQLLDRLESAMTVAGSEAFYAARDYYKLVQLNAKMGVPGAQAIYEDLKRLFEQTTRGAARKEEEEE